MSNSDGPLPQWRALAHGGPYEAVAQGVTWRLWYDASPSAGDPHPAGWRLAHRDALDSPALVQAGDGNLVEVLDTAGWLITH